MSQTDDGLENRHATMIAFDRNGRRYGVLLRGPSGAGKSELALHLIETAGARLVADDQVLFDMRDGRVVARAPQPLSGQLEVRGFGPAAVACLESCPLDLVVDLMPQEAMARLPDQREERIAGKAFPVIALDPKARTVAARLAVILESLTPHAATSKPGTKPGTKPDCVIVTGLSGAGRSSALKVFEDLGFEAIDNLPLRFLDSLVKDPTRKEPLAIGLDSRQKIFSAVGVRVAMERMKAAGRRVELIYLDCTDEALARRFTETRRRHPLAQDRPVADGIRAERRLMEDLKVVADLVIDTTDLPINQLRATLAGPYVLAESPGLALHLISFSYKLGLPRSADLVFDVRFLANPHYDAALRGQSGLDAPVADYVRADPGFEVFWRDLTALLAFCLPRYRQEGKAYLTLALGCTGGRHRSVFMAEALAHWFKEQGYKITVSHRDLEARP